MGSCLGREPTCGMTIESSGEAQKLTIHTVSGEIAASIDYSRSHTGRSIKELVSSATGGRVKLMSLLYKNNLVGDHTQLSSLGISCGEPLTLVSRSGAELVRLPNFNGVYFGTLSHPDSYTIVIDSADFVEVGSKFRYDCRGVVHLVRSSSAWSSLSGRDSDTIPIVIDIRGNLDPAGALLLTPFGPTRSAGPAELPQLYRPGGMALSFTADGSVILLNSATFEEITLTRASDSKAADLEPMEWTVTAKSHLESLIRDFACDAVGPGVAAFWTKHAPTDSRYSTDVECVLQMDRSLSRIEIIELDTGMIPQICMSIQFTDVDSFEKDCVNTSALHCMFTLHDGVHNQTTFVFDSTSERNRAFTCFKLFRMATLRGAELFE